MTTDRSHRAFGLFYLIVQMGKPPLSALHPFTKPSAKDGKIGERCVPSPIVTVPRSAASFQSAFVRALFLYIYRAGYIGWCGQLKQDRHEQLCRSAP